jgi:hypothetical protein
MAPNGSSVLYFYKVISESVTDMTRVTLQDHGSLYIRFNGELGLTNIPEEPLHFSGFVSKCQGGRIKLKRDYGMPYLLQKVEDGFFESLKDRLVE